MILLFSKMIDCYALNNLHRTRSKEFQYTYLPTWIPETTDREIFYKVHPTDIFVETPYLLKNHKVGTFQFKSLAPSGDPSNDYVTGEVFLNELENVPNVIFVHGWRMNSFDRVKKIFHKRIMNDLKWDMYYFPLPYPIHFPFFALDFINEIIGLQEHSQCFYNKEGQEKSNKKEQIQKWGYQTRAGFVLA